MEKSLDESMFGDIKDKTKVQSSGEIMRAICTNPDIDVNLSEDKLVNLGDPVQDSRQVPTWEEIIQAIRTNLDTDVNLSEDKLVNLEDLVRYYRKVKSSRKHRPNQRRVPPRIFSNEWRDQAEESKNFIMRNPQHSYHNIKSPQLKLCLLSVAVFPEDSIIKRRSLIYWWIGQGLVSQREDKTAEQVGEEVYAELLKQGLIELDDNDPIPPTSRCKINPSIRYTLISEAEDAGLLYFEPKEKTSEACPLCSIHLHLLVGSDDIPQFKEPQFRELQLRDLARGENVFTVFNVNQEYLSLPLHWLLNMRNLRVLQLGRWQHSPVHHIEVDRLQFLNDLGVYHKHLKFLSLRGICRIRALPDSIVELVSLEILDLQACHNLEKLPKDLASLKKLTHLDISKCYLIERMPKGIEKLSSLQVLKGFVIGIARKDPCKISDLQRLTKLRRLSIYIGGATKWDVEFAFLKEVASLCSLTISWGVNSLALQSSLPINQFLPQQLEKLELIGMPERSTPKWLNPQELKNLKKLYIIGGELANWDHQQQNEQWSVEMLRLKHLRKLSIGNKEDVLKKFPRLGYLEKINCADNDLLWNKNRPVEKGL